MGHTQSRLRIGIQQPFIALLHTWGHILGLADLIAGDEAAIEYLKYEDSEIVRVDSRQRMAFDGLPA